jgi:hypothetical protein
MISLKMLCKKIVRKHNETLAISWCNCWNKSFLKWFLIGFFFKCNEDVWEIQSSKLAFSRLDQKECYWDVNTFTANPLPYKIKIGSQSYQWSLVSISLRLRLNFFYKIDSSIIRTFTFKKLQNTEKRNRSITNFRIKYHNSILVYNNKNIIL